MSNPKLDAHTYDRYMSLPLEESGAIQAEYVWIGGDGYDLRSKSRTIYSYPTSPDDLPVWNFDGSSTKQAPGDDSEVLLKPVKFVPDPFRRGKNILVLCECLKPDGSAVNTNSRLAAKDVFDNPKVKDEHPWYGIEQEYTLFLSDKRTPLGWPKGGYPGPQVCSQFLGNFDVQY